MPFSAWSLRHLPSNEEGPRDDTDRQCAQLAGDGGHDGRTAGAGTAALAGGDEHHVGAAQQFLDLILGVLGGLFPDFGVGTGTQPPGRLASDVELDVGVGHQQRLGVGVDRDELHALEALLDHPVDGVDAAAADPDDFDDGQVVMCGGVIMVFLPGGNWHVTRRSGKPQPQVEG